MATTPRVAVLALGAAATGVLLAGAWIPAWSRDEAATAMVVRRPIAQVLRTFEHDPAIESYYLLLNAWALVSSSELWLRLPSVFAAAATVVVLVKIAEHFVSWPAALLAGVLLLVLPATTRYGQDARPYALTMLVAALVVLSWLQDRSLSGWWPRVRLGLLLVALGLLHAYALLIIAVLAAVALARPEQDRRREVLGVLGVGLAATLLLAPFLWIVAWAGQGPPNRSALTPVNVVVETLRLPAGVLSATAGPVLAVVAFVLVLAGWVIGWHGDRFRTGVVLAGSWLVLPPVALCVLQGVTEAPGLVTRYWLFCLPAVALAAAFALDAAWRVRRWSSVAVVAVVGLLGLPTQVELRSLDGHAGRGWRELPPLLVRPELSGTAVLVEGSQYRALVANQRTVAARMPLVADPAPSGRVLPQIERADSAAFRDLRTRFPVAVVLQNLARPSSTPPKAEEFVDFRAELRWFSRPVVLCSYFGFPLGVFTARPVSPEDGREIAGAIRAVDPTQVSCTVAG